jgi:RNA polymerase sigma-70 factor, ECF subfamily
VHDGGRERLTNEPQPIAELYQRWGAVAYRRCLRILGDRELARDATQEVFLKLTRDLHRLRDPKTALAWIYRTATHHCLNQLRSARRHAAAQAPLMMVEPSYADAFPDQQLGRQLLERFDLTTRAVAVAMLVDGMSRDEAAEVLGLSPRTVSRRLERFLARARLLLAERVS